MKKKMFTAMMTTTALSFALLALPASADENADQGGVVVEANEDS